MSTIMPSGLQASQQAMLTALFAHPGDDLTDAPLGRFNFGLDIDATQTSRGWMAYRANGHALAERTLSTAYPVVVELVGADNFALLARDLWHRHPPTQGDLARWGGDLAAWVANCKTMTDVPYLADVARVEWALHGAATWPDAALDTPSFARLSCEDPSTLSLALAPGTTLIDSDFPVVALINAHKRGEPEFSEVGAMLRAGLKQSALVWREGLRPRLACCQPAVQVLMRALLEGSDLVTSLEAISTAEVATSDKFDFDFSEWLTGAVTDGLVIGVRTAAPHSSTSLE